MQLYGCKDVAKPFTKYKALPSKDDKFSFIFTNVKILMPLYMLKNDLLII